MSGIAFPLKPISYTDFTGGLNITDNILSLKPNESPYIKNYIFAAGGGLTSRLGMTLLKTLAGGNNPGQGGWVYKSVGNVNPKVLLSVQNGTLYSILLSNNTQTTLMGSLSTSLLYDGTEFNGDFWVTNSTDGLIHIYYNGATLTATKIATAPLGSMITSDGKGRLFIAGNPTYPNRVYFCSFLNGTDWQTVNNAGFFDITWAEEDTITCIKHNGSYLEIGGSKSIKTANTGDPFNISVTDVAGSYGIANQQSTVLLNNWLFFATNNNGIWSSNYFYPETISQKILPVFLGTNANSSGAIPTITVNNSQMSKACAVQDGYWYRISLCKGGATANNCQLMYHSIYKSWTYFEGQNIAWYALDSDNGTIYAGDSANGNVYTLNNGYTDNGTNIAVDYYSAPYDSGMPEASRIASWALVHTDNKGTSQISFSYLFDLGNSADTKALNTNTSNNVWGTSNATGILQWGTDPNNPADLWASTAIVTTKIFMHGRGRWIQGRLFSNSTSSQININSWELAEVQLLPG